MCTVCFYSLIYTPVYSLQKNKIIHVLNFHFKLRIYGIVIGKYIFIAYNLLIVNVLIQSNSRPIICIHLNNISPNISVNELNLIFIWFIILFFLFLGGGRMEFL